LNSRPSPWQGDALPLSYSRFLKKPQKIAVFKVVERNVPLFVPLCPEALFSTEALFPPMHGLPLKHADASRCGMPFIRNHGARSCFFLWSKDEQITL
jgi:hypothetical protein